MKVIHPLVHSILDYTLVLLLLSSPSIFEFSLGISLLTIVLGGVHLTITLLTNTKGGYLRIIPFSLHGLIELIVSIVLFLFALLFPFQLPIEAKFYLYFASAVFVVWLLTDYSVQENQNSLT